jgi:lysophospholipase L1-like esterase
MSTRWSTWLLLLLSVLFAVEQCRGGLRLKIMPLGDSLSICCHRCSVPSTSITGKGRTEPVMPWEGYIRKLWLLLDAARRDKNSSFEFEFVGRVRTCMINSSQEMRVKTSDWDVRYEGYYGYPTGRILSEVLEPALAAADPDIVLVILGTNDLIQAKAGSGSRVQRAVQNLRSIVRRVLCIAGARDKGGVKGVVAGPLDSSKGGAICEGRKFSRQVVIGTVPPILFSAVRAASPAARKPHRLRQLNDAIKDMVVEFHAMEEASNLLLDRPGRRLHLADLTTNFSVHDDLHGDGLHPNEAGERKIAQRMLHVLLHDLELADPSRQILAAQPLPSRAEKKQKKTKEEEFVPVLNELLEPEAGISVDALLDTTLLLCVSASILGWMVMRRRSAFRIKRGE